MDLGYGDYKEANTHNLRILMRSNRLKCSCLVVVKAEMRSLNRAQIKKDDLKSSFCVVYHGYTTYANPSADLTVDRLVITFIFFQSVADGHVDS